MWSQRCFMQRRVGANLRTFFWSGSLNGSSLVSGPPALLAKPTSSAPVFREFRLYHGKQRSVFSMPCIQVSLCTSSLAFLCLRHRKLKSPSGRKGNFLWGGPSLLSNPLKISSSFVSGCFWGRSQWQHKGLFLAVGRSIIIFTTADPAVLVES